MIDVVNILLSARRSGAWLSPMLCNIALLDMKKIKGRKLEVHHSVRPYNKMTNIKAV